MSPGKLAAQVAHASQLGLLTHVDPSKNRTNPYDDAAVNRWLRGGHYAKVVLETTDDLATVERYINDRGFKTALIIDEGRTEFGGGLTPTAIGTGVVDKDWPHCRETFGDFKLYGTLELKQQIDDKLTFIERLRRGARLKCS
jgi:peptidyl-tRNA hydrolase